MTAINQDNLWDVIGKQKLTLVEFYAPGCPYCRRLAPAFEQVAEQYADRLAVGQINIEASPKLAEVYTVELVPTLVLFENGEPIDDIVAPETKAMIEDMIRKHVGAVAILRADG